MSEQSGQTSVYVQTEGKNIVIAYVLWFFLGYLGIHRFYLGRTGTAIAQLVLMIAGFVTFGVTLIVLGIWWLVDIALIPGIVARANRAEGADGRIRLVNSGPAQPGAAPPQDDLSQIERLFDLKERGVISEEEYQTRRARVIDEYQGTNA